MLMNGKRKKEEEKEDEEIRKVTVTDDEMKEMFTRRELSETKCGIGPFKPKWIQRLATKEMYMFVYSLVGVTQGMFFTYSVSVISTIEKRFKLTSKQSGILMSGNDISQVMLAIFLGYYGTFGHRPRWLGVGALLTAASCFCAALPHLIYGPGEDAIQAARVATLYGNESAEVLASFKSNEELCHNKPDDSCAEDQTWDYIGSYLLFFLAQFLVGIAISILFSIGVTYLDDNINKKTYPIYYTLTILLRILGPVLGFIVGGKCLSIWIDPAQEPNINKSDPRWLGAWWLGLIFIAAALTITALPLFLFPLKLPATLRREAKRYKRKAEREKRDGGHRKVENFVEESRLQREKVRPNIKNLWAAIKRLFSNKVWSGNLFSSTISIMAISGFYSFQPKYLENQFRKSAAEANYFTGMASLIVSVVGAVISGGIMRWCRPGPRLVTGYNIFVTLISCVGFMALMYVGCPKLDVIGPVEGSYSPACSSECECTDKYTPVCSQDNVTLFYSPCYAGCSKDNIAANPIEYSGCRCITNSTSALNSTSLIPEDMWGKAYRGYCPEPCNGFFYYFLIQIITKTIVSTSRIGNSIVLLRAVSEEDKGVSLGMITVFISLFGFIPAPIIMGAIIDSACIVWDKSCGKTGNCWLYDSDKFRKILHLVPAIFIFISMVGDIVVYRNCEHLDLYGLKDDHLDNMETTPGSQEEAEPLQSKRDMTKV